MYWAKDTYALPYVGSPIRTSAGRWICAPHRSFSQLITSFFGSQCQGILLMLLLTWPLTYVSVNIGFLHYCLNFSELFLVSQQIDLVNRYPLFNSFIVIRIPPTLRAGPSLWQYSIRCLICFLLVCYSIFKVQRKRIAPLSNGGE